MQNSSEPLSIFDLEPDELDLIILFRRMTPQEKKEFLERYDSKSDKEK